MVPVYVHSLSALKPVKFVYNFNKAEHFTGTLNTFKNGFGYYLHEGLKNFQDAALSNKTCLILTDNVKLKTLFESDSRYINIGTIAGCLYLKTSSNYYITTSLDGGIYVGGTGEKMFINVVPIEENLVELRVGKNSRIQIDALYPYTAKVSKEFLDDQNLHRQRFEIDYKDNLISFRTKTAEGWRYLSYGADRTIRANGLMLNDTVINSYLFVADFVSSDAIYYDFDAKTSEVKYYNEISTYGNRDTVNIKEEQESSTNLLITVPTAEITKTTSDQVPVNISLTKTNFSSSGSYTTKRTL